MKEEQQENAGVKATRKSREIAAGSQRAFWAHQKKVRRRKQIRARRQEVLAEVSKPGMIRKKQETWIWRHRSGVGLFIIAALFLWLVSTVISSCGVFMQGSLETIARTSFSATDEDILGVDADYTAMEQRLLAKWEAVETLHPGYDEYRYQLTEVGHNPFELAAWLTVMAEGYRQGEVETWLVQLLEAQYPVTLDEKSEMRTRMETRMGSILIVDPDTGETEERSYEYEVVVEYEVRILTVKLENWGVTRAARVMGMDAEQAARYEALLMTKGCRETLFAGSIYVDTTYLKYDIPGEALSDVRFARMIQEAEKYLGYPYVWGGASPKTSFDCSGYVSWVINHCGNGWNVGRLTAKGLMNICDIIPATEAAPGDLIFFQGTYETIGASHVGIYVGDQMMLHCGNPISYASVETTYWRQHFLCYGRLPK